MEHSYRTKDVLRLADSERYPHRLRGFTALDSNAVVKFPCGLGVAIHHGRGSLAAIWPLTKARRLPRTRETLGGKVVPVQAPIELGDAYFEQCHFGVLDGVHVKYGLEGDLRWIVSIEGGAMNGLCLRLEPEGFVRPQDSGIFQQGKLIERFQESLLPDGFLGHVLGNVVLPMKKALKIGLSPCEERLCYEHFVDVDRILPADLNASLDQSPEVEEIREPSSSLEWWRPQVSFSNPNKIYDQQDQRFNFAPLGPASFRRAMSPTWVNASVSTEVSPFRSSPKLEQQEKQEKFDDDLKEIFMLGSRTGGKRKGATSGTLS
eukprot:symbB.v1.2.004931.t1/scaffold285.1/size239547/5